MNSDAEYEDKQKDLEAIFEIAYKQGLPLSGEHRAIALAQRMSRASFYLIPEAVREQVRQEVEARIDAEREAEPVAGYRVHRSWWVAEDAISGVTRDGRSYALKLNNGMVVPISRHRIAELRSAFLSRPGNSQRRGNGSSS